jgi:hypothetical protein
MAARVVRAARAAVADQRAAGARLRCALLRAAHLELTAEHKTRAFLQLLTASCHGNCGRNRRSVFGSRVVTTDRWQQGQQEQQKQQRRIYRQELGCAALCRALLSWHRLLSTTHAGNSCDCWGGNYGSGRSRMFSGRSDAAAAVVAVRAARAARAAAEAHRETGAQLRCALLRAALRAQGLELTASCTLLPALAWFDGLGCDSKRYTCAMPFT